MHQPYSTPPVPPHVSPLACLEGLVHLSCSNCKGFDCHFLHTLREDGGTGKGLADQRWRKSKTCLQRPFKKKHETNIYFFCLSNKGGSIFGRCLNSTREYINCEIYQVFFLSKVCISWMISSFLGIIRCVLEMHITYP